MLTYSQWPAKAYREKVDALSAFVAEKKINYV